MKQNNNNANSSLQYTEDILNKNNVTEQEILYTIDYNAESTNDQTYANTNYDDINNYQNNTFDNSEYPPNFIDDKSDSNIDALIYEKFKPIDSFYLSKKKIKEMSQEKKINLPDTEINNIYRYFYDKQLNELDLNSYLNKLCTKRFLDKQQEGNFSSNEAENNNIDNNNIDNNAIKDYLELKERLDKIESRFESDSSMTHNDNRESSYYGYENMNVYPSKHHQTTRGHNLEYGTIKDIFKLTLLEEEQKKYHSESQFEKIKNYLDNRLSMTESIIYSDSSSHYDNKKRVISNSEEFNNLINKLSISEKERLDLINENRDIINTLNKLDISEKERLQELNENNNIKNIVSNLNKTLSVGKISDKNEENKNESYDSSTSNDVIVANPTINTDLVPNLTEIQEIDTTNYDLPLDESSISSHISKDEKQNNYVESESLKFNSINNLSDIGYFEEIIDKAEAELDSKDSYDENQNLKNDTFIASDEIDETTSDGNQSKDFSSETEIEDEHDSKYSWKKEMDSSPTLEELQNTSASLGTTTLYNEVDIEENFINNKLSKSLSDISMIKDLVKDDIDEELERDLDKSIKLFSDVRK